MKTKKLLIELPAELKDNFKAYCKEHRISQKDMIAYLILTKLNEGL